MMKAKTIQENIGFKRGQDPKEGMGIGLAALKDKMWKEFTENFDDTGGMVPVEARVYRGVECLLIDSHRKRYNWMVIWKRPAGGGGYTYGELSKWERSKAGAWKRSEDIIDQEIADFIIRESISFERGKDPKDSMRVGVAANARKVRHLLRWSRKSNIGDAPVKKRFAIDILQNPQRNTRATTTSVLFDDDKRERLDNVLRSGVDLIYDGILWVNTKTEWGSYSYTPHPLNESVSFERGRDPKTTMGLGDPFLRAKAKAEKFLADQGFEFFEEEVADGLGWGSSYSKYIWKHKRWPSRQVEIIDLILNSGTDKEERMTMLNMRRGSGYQTTGPNFRLKGDSKAHWNHFFDTFYNTYSIPATKRIYESVNFERGRDPKRALGIGDRDAQYTDDITNIVSEYGINRVPISLEPESHLHDVAQWENKDRGYTVILSRALGDNESYGKNGYMATIYQGDPSNINNIIEEFNQELMLIPEAWENILLK